MKTSYFNTEALKATRNFGGTTKGTAEPYITGYHFIKVAHAPSMLKNHLSPNPGNVSGDSDINRILEATCASVTPPGGTLNKTEFNGLGGTKWSAPTNIDYGTSLTMRFVEFEYLPVLTVIHSWVKMIRDYRTGVSALVGGELKKENYAATIYYWTTKPDGRTVEYSACYTGVFPTKDPQDLFTGDLTASDKLEMDIDFNVDWIWHEDWVHNNCQNYSNTRGGSAGVGHRGNIHP
tara:strand:- start:338 stop:1042 length:705 start_codon:yes stop_codon:yes gene_type:complete